MSSEETHHFITAEFRRPGETLWSSFGRQFKTLRNAREAVIRAIWNLRAMSDKNSKLSPVFSEYRIVEHHDVQKILAYYKDGNETGGP